MKKIRKNPNGFAKDITTKIHGKDFETPTMMLTYSFRLNNPRPWKQIPNCSVMTNAYDILQNGKLENRIRKKGIHSELELNGEICAMDSGGYQFISRGEGEEIDPLKVIELQNQSRVDIAVCLDYPILQDFSPEKSRKLTQQSLENIKLSYEKITPGIEVMPVIHGATVKDTRLFLDEVEKIGDFTIWGIGGIVPEPSPKTR